MAGNHRAPRRGPSGLPAWSLGLAVALTVGAAVWFAAEHWYGGIPGSGSAEPTATATGTPSPTSSATPTATGTPTAGPTSTASTRTPTATATPTRRITRVRPDTPRQLTSGQVLDVGFDNSIEPANGLLLPASDAEVARWGSRGRPGSPGTDTVYVVGRTDTAAGSALRALPRMGVGNRITIRTDSGRITYTVRRKQDLAERALLRDRTFTAKSPGRLYLIGVRYDSTGRRTGRVLMLTAELTAASRG